MLRNPALIPPPSRLYPLKTLAFPILSRLIPPYPAFLKYPVPLQQELHAAIASLPDKQAKRIYAHFILGMTKQDIARAEGVDEKVIRVAIERGLRHLEKILKKSL